MSRWRPKLVVRRGRGGGVASPTTTAGVVISGLIGTVAFSSVVLIVSKEAPWVLVMLLFPLLQLRDIVAWVVATEPEREAFRSEIAELQAWSANSSPLTKTITNGRATQAVLFGLAGVASLFAGAYLFEPFFVAALLFFSFAVVHAIDLARRKLQSP